MSSKKPKVATLQTMPTTVTSGFGTGSYDPKTGAVGYSLSDPLAGMRDEFYGAAQDFLPSQEQQDFATQVGDYGRGLFSSATQYDIGQMTSDYYNQQQDILRPDRDIESASMRDRMFGTGRLGYGTGTEGGYINPEQYAMQRARETANAQLFLGAEDRARGIQQQDITRGLGMIDSESALNMNPYRQAGSLFGMGTGIEGLGYSTLNTVGQFSPLQMQWQQSMQANQQAKNNAKASGGMGGLLGGLVKAGLNYATGGMSGMFTGAMGGGGSSPFGALGGWFNNSVAPNLFSGFDGSSPSSSMFGGSSGWGGNYGSVDMNVANYTGAVYPRY
jgi:hypothetical protein